MRMFGAAKFLVVLVSGLALFAPPALAQGELFGRIMGLAIEKARENAQENAQENAAPVTPAPKQPVVADEPQDDYPEVAQSGDSIGLLYDTDLPYNDYRSGMDDPDLKGIRLGACVQLCEADGRCQAFTYNSKARVCFLKYSAASPVRFKGAVSGIKGGGGSSFVSVPADEEEAEPSRRLSQAEIAELQQALTDAGYDAGAPDGRIGSRTRKAAAAFRRDNPDVAGDGIDLELLLAVSAGGSGPGAAASGFSAASYVPLDKAERLLGLAMVAAAPTLMDDDYTVELWLRNDARNDTGIDADATQAAYRDANAIERAAILKRYGEAIRKEAAAFAADPANRQLRIAVSRDAGFGSFVEGTGLMLGRPDDPLFTSNRFDVSNDLVRVDLVGAALSMPEELAVPAQTEQEASAFIDRARANSARLGLTAYLTLSTFGTDGNVTGAALTDEGDIAVTVTLDRLSFVTLWSNNSAAAAGGSELAVLLGDQQPLGSRDPVRLAGKLGIPVYDGNIALVGDNWSSYPSDALARFFSLAGLARDPSLAAGRPDNEQLLALMSTSQRIRVFGSTDTYAFSSANEFDRRRALQVFNEQVVPELVESAPAFPVPVVAIKSVRFGDYDFDARAFPLSYGDAGRVVFVVPASLGGFRTDQSYADLPATLPMEEAAAEALVKGVRYESDRMLVMAVFGQLVLTDDQKLRIEPARAGIFRDAELKQQLSELNPATLLVSGDAGPAAEPGAAPQAWAGRLELPSYRGLPLFTPDNFPGRDQLTGAVALFALSQRQDALENPAWTMPYAFALGVDLAPYLTSEGARRFIERNFSPDYRHWAGADEFQKEDSRKRFLAENRDRIKAMLPRFPLDIAVLRRASIGQYDAAAGGFPLGIVTQSDMSPYNGAVELRLTLDASGEDQPLLTMTEPEAREFREMLRNLTDTQLDPATFRAASVGIPAGELATVSRYRISGVQIERGDVVFSASPIGRTLHPLSDLSRVILDLPYPGAPVEDLPSPAEVATRNGSADAPQSSFDILGISLGMPLDKAKALLDTRFEGRNATSLSLREADTGSLTSCGIVENRMSRDLSGVTDPDEQQAIRDSYIDDFAKAECPTSATSVLEFAFGYDVPQEEEGEVDRIVVFKASQSGDIVGAVAREVSEGMMEALTNGLLEKYGTNFKGDADSQYRVWPSDPSMAPLFNDYTTGCTPPWPELVRLPQAYFNQNCGAFVRQLSRQVLLVDTRYNLLQAQAIAVKLAAAEAAQPKPKLDF